MQLEDMTRTCQCLSNPGARYMVRQVLVLVLVAAYACSRSCSGYKRNIKVNSFLSLLLARGTQAEGLLVLLAKWATCLSNSLVHHQSGIQAVSLAPLAKHSLSRSCHHDMSSRTWKPASLEGPGRCLAPTWRPEHAETFLKASKCPAPFETFPSPIYQRQQCWKSCPQKSPHLLPGSPRVLASSHHVPIRSIRRVYCEFRSWAAMGRVDDSRAPALRWTGQRFEKWAWWIRMKHLLQL